MDIVSGTLKQTLLMPKLLPVVVWVMAPALLDYRLSFGGGCDRRERELPTCDDWASYGPPSEPESTFAVYATVRTSPRRRKTCS